MSSQTEATSREVEQILDRLITDTIAQLKEHNVTITDQSARTYHYKNHFLSWSYRFESQRLYRGPEIALVTVSMTWDEPAVVDASREIRVWSQAAILQIGKVSRWKHIIEQGYPIEVVISRGVTTIIWEYFRRGYAAIDRV